MWCKLIPDFITSSSSMWKSNKDSISYRLLRMLIYFLILDHHAVLMSNLESNKNSAVTHRHRHHHNHMNQHSQHVGHNNNNNNKNSHQHHGRLKEIFLTKKNHGHLNWNGESQSSCTFISTTMELENSKECNKDKEMGKVEKKERNDDFSYEDDDFFKDSEEKVGKKKRNIEDSLSLFLAKSDDINLNTSHTKKNSNTNNHMENDSLDRDGVWISCGAREACSVVYQVDKGWKIKQIFISGAVDRKAEILIQAQYLKDKGTNYQLRRLYHGDGTGHGISISHSQKNYDNKQGDDDYRNDAGDEERKTELTTKAFSYYHEGFQDVSTLNVTSVLHGGFSLINNITIIVEKDYDLPIHSTFTEKNPVVHSIILDTKGDVYKHNEWLDVTCHYGEFHSELWVFSCSDSSRLDYDPASSGIWSPCNEKSCSFLYDGSSLNSPKSLVIDGYFHGGSISLSGKSHRLESQFKLISSRQFHNSKVLQVHFNLTNVCNASVLQILVSSSPGQDSTMLIDKINVQLQSTSKASSSSCEQISEVVQHARATDPRNSLKSLNSTATVCKGGSLEMFVILQVFMFMLLAKSF